MTLSSTSRPASSEDEAGRFRVAVLRSGALGDFVLTLPVLTLLRRGIPRAEIVFGGRPEFGALAQMAGCVDRVVQEDSPAFTSLFVEEGSDSGKAAREFGGIDIAVSFLNSDTVSENLLRVGAGQVVAHSPLPPEGSAVHAADHLAAALRGSIDVPATSVPTIAVPPEVASRAAAMLDDRGLTEGKYLVVHPGSGSAKKNWPAARYAEVIAEYKSLAGNKAAVVAGPAEQDSDELHAELDGVADAWFDSPRLTVLSGVLSKARCFIGNDSGASHLAAACGAATVSIFGPTDPAVWAPRGARVSVVRSASGQLDDVQVSDVSSALKNLLEGQA